MSDTLILEPQAPLKRQAAKSENRNIPNCYWRKGPNESDPGWIIVGPGLETRQADRWIRCGRTALPQYSLTDRLSPKTGEREPIETNADDLPRNRFYWFFKNGGAKEFTVNQIVEHKWHIKPPYGMSVEVFPQLGEYDLPSPLWCQICPPSAPPKNSPAQLIQHAMISHSLKLPEAKALLEDAETPPAQGGLAPVLRKKSEMAPEKVVERKARAEKLAEDVPDVSLSPSKTICNSCGSLIEGKLADHQCS